MAMDGVTHDIGKWDLLIAHPPCTYLSNAGARFLYPKGVLNEQRLRKGIMAKDFFLRFWWADIPKIAVENPIPSSVYCMPKYTQIIQPYQFGHPFKKRTCLWLKGLPELKPTDEIPLDNVKVRRLREIGSIMAVKTDKRTGQKLFRELQRQWLNSGDNDGEQRKDSIRNHRRGKNGNL